jgi:hypothetical protein
MEMWGTNPGGNLNLVTRRIAEQFRDSDPDGMTNFLKQVNSRWGVSIENVMQHLDGRASIHTNEMAATIGRTIRQFDDMVYLGGVAFTHAGSGPYTLTKPNRLSTAGSAPGRLIWRYCSYPQKQDPNRPARGVRSYSRRTRSGCGG